MTTRRQRVLSADSRPSYSSNTKYEADEMMYDKTFTPEMILVINKQLGIQLDSLPLEKNLLRASDLMIQKSMKVFDPFEDIKFKNATKDVKNSTHKAFYPNVRKPNFMRNRTSYDSRAQVIDRVEEKLLKQLMSLNPQKPSLIIQSPTYRKIKTVPHSNRNRSNMNSKWTNMISR